MEKVEEKFVSIFKIEKSIFFTETVNYHKVVEFEKKYCKKFTRSRLNKKYEKRKNDQLFQLKMYFPNKEESVYAFIYL